MGLYIWPNAFLTKIWSQKEFDLKSLRIERILEVKNQKKLYGTICTIYFHNLQQYCWYIFAKNQLFLFEKNKYWKLIVIIEYL